MATLLCKYTQPPIPPKIMDYYLENTTEVLFFEKNHDLFETTTYNNTYDEETIDNTKITLGLYNMLIPFIGAIAIVLNLTVVVSSGLILKKGQQPKTTYLFMGNLALTDFVTCLSVVFGQAYPNNLRNHVTCAIQMGMIVSSTLASVYSVGLIAVDRYLYLLHGLMYQKWMYPKRSLALIRITWFFGCIIGCLPLMGWSGDTRDGRQCWFILLSPKYLILLTVIYGIIPLITVIVLYCLILFHAISNIFRLKKAEKDETDISHISGNGLRIFHGRSLDPSEQEHDDRGWFKRILLKKPSHKVNGPNKWKAVKVVIFTSGAFLITWGPYFTAALIYIFVEDEKVAKQLQVLIASPLAILGFCNSLINPIIYAWWHKGFRHFVLRSWSAAKRKNRESTQSQFISKTTSSTQARNSSTEIPQNEIVHYSAHI